MIELVYNKIKKIYMKVKRDRDASKVMIAYTKEHGT